MGFPGGRTALAECTSGPPPGHGVVLTSDAGVRREQGLVGRRWLALQPGTAELVACEACAGTGGDSLAEVDVRELEARREPPADVRAAFDKFDTNRNGTIDSRKHFRANKKKKKFSKILRRRHCRRRHRWFSWRYCE